MRHPSITPDESYTSILDIDFAALATHHPYLIFDLDNTLLPLRARALRPAIRTLFRELRDNPAIHDICLVSNIGIPTPHSMRRLIGIASELGVHYIRATGWRLKPHPRPFRRAMELMGSIPQNTVVIGDQLLTDIKGGKALGLYTVLVKSLGKHGWYTRYRQWLMR